MQYFITPNHCIAVNSKVGTNSICQAIVENYYPERLEGIEIEVDWQWRTLVHQTHLPDKPILLLLRNPINRFLSACAMFNVPPQKIIDNLPNWKIEEINEQYFLPQTRFTAAKIFKFPEQINQFCKEAGFRNLPILHEASNSKPQLTVKQLEFIKKYYQKDINIYES